MGDIPGFSGDPPDRPAVSCGVVFSFPCAPSGAVCFRYLYTACGPLANSVNISGSLKNIPYRFRGGLI